MKTLISTCWIMPGAIFFTFGMNGLHHFFPLPDTTTEEKILNSLVAFRVPGVPGQNY